MKRTIEVVSRGTKLSLKDSRVQVRLENETLASIPIEDLGMVILSTTGVSISSGVISAMGSNGGAILACDDSFQPCGLFLPLAANSLHSERARLQAETSLPLKKNLWARIMKTKILNQAHVLTDDAGARRLKLLAEKVRSGDEGNKESEAARIYWPLVFAKFPMVVGKSFHRYRHGAPPNNLLNYGYTVLRASVARALCVAGLHPAMGIHHRNRYSGFCLADDVMEPFRPYVDQSVLGLVASNTLELNKDAKYALIGTLMRNVRIKGETMALSIALERTCSSLAKAIEHQVKNGASATEAAEVLVLPLESGPCH